MYSWQFPKKFSSPQKWRPFCIFEFLPKMEKHKFASISLTVRDRAISSKFSTRRVSEQCTLGNFQKILLFPHMAAILNFCQKWKNTNLLIFLTVRDRAISSKFSTHRVSKQCTLGNFQNIFLFPKMAAILNFSQKLKNRNLLLSPSIKIFDPPNAKRHEAEIIYMYTNKYLSIIDIFYK